MKKGILTFLLFCCLLGLTANTHFAQNDRQIGFSSNESKNPVSPLTKEAVLPQNSFVNLDNQTIGNNLNQSSSRPFEHSPHPLSSRKILAEQAMTFWLVDNNGNWKIPLPNWTMDDVLKNIDLSEKPQEVSSYIIQSLNANGKVVDNMAQLSIQYRINTQNNAVVRVPLGLKEGVYISEDDKNDIYKAIRYSGPGSFYIDYDESQGGYIAVIQNIPKTINKNRLSVNNIGSLLNATQNKKQNSDIQTNNLTSQNENIELIDSEPVASNIENQENNATEPVAPNVENQENNATESKSFRSYNSSRFNFRSGNDSNNSSRSGLIQHSITLELSFPVEKISKDEYRLRASFPPAVHSKVIIEVPLPEIQMTVSQGVIANPPSSKDETTSEITLNGLNRNGETTELVWRKKESPFRDSQISLQVEDAEIIVSPDLQKVIFDVTLPIRISGGSENTFRIRLPEKTELIRDSVIATGINNNSIEIREIREDSNLPAPQLSETTPSPEMISNTDSNASSEKSLLNDQSDSLFEIRLSQQIQDQLFLRFKAVMQNTQTNTATTYEDRELGGFELLRAQKQYGMIRIVMPNDLMFNVKPVYGVRETSEGLSENDEAEHFAYFTQPFSLKAQVVERQARINVKPEYQLQIQQNQAELVTRLQYTIHGAKVHQLSIKLGRWVVKEINPDNNIDISRVYTDSQNNELKLSLKVATEGVVDITLVAVQEIDPNNDLLELSVPVPVADWIDPAALIVFPDDNIELSPLPEKMNNLSAKSLRSFTLSLEQPTRQQSPLSYQVDQGQRNTFSEETTVLYPLFVSKMKICPQEVFVKSETTVQLLNKETDQIQQTLIYSIQHEPIESLTLLVPSDIRDSDALKISIDGKTVQSPNIITEPGDESNPSLIYKRIMLPEGPRIGNCLVVLTYSIRSSELEPNFTNSIKLNLIQPVDGTFLSNDLKVNVPAGLTLQPQDILEQPWKMKDNNALLTGQIHSYHFYCNSKQKELRLSGTLNAKDVLGTTVIEKVWIQSWFVHSTRLDQIVYRMSSDQNAITVRLPQEVRQERLRVSFDQNLNFEDANQERLFSFAEGLLTIQIPESLKNISFLLEISYLLEFNDPQNIWNVDFPKFNGDSTWIRRAYWQIILPQNKHILGGMEGWTAEYYNKFFLKNLFWKRVASMEQDELCTWIGIKNRESISSDTNCYLLSSFSQPEQCRLTVVNRSLLIFVGSGITLLIGLGFIYLPVMNYRGIVFCIIVIFVSIISYRPIISFLFMQTTIFGVLLTLLTSFFTKLFVKKDDWNQRLRNRQIKQTVLTEIQGDSSSRQTSIRLEEK
ncbi:MAG: hypothetical protein Q4C95_11900 [Planctomycetia bacterium]|nr:hypothetical protein [Planctomycetia bacterium]